MPRGCPRTSAQVLYDFLDSFGRLDDRVWDVLGDVRRLPSQPTPHLQSLPFPWQARVPLPEEQLALEFLPAFGDVFAVPRRWWVSLRSPFAILVTFGVGVDTVDFIAGADGHCCVIGCGKGIRKRLWCLTEENPWSGGWFSRSPLKKPLALQEGKVRCGHRSATTADYRFILTVFGSAQPLTKGRPPCSIQCTCHVNDNTP